ncbi:MAK10-like protein [Tanacetum coccineum]
MRLLDRLKPSPLPDSWKPKEMFAARIILGGYLPFMTDYEEHQLFLRVSGKGFMARDIRFHDVAGPEKEHAVALRVNSQEIKEKTELIEGEKTAALRAAAISTRFILTTHRNTSSALLEFIAEGCSQLSRVRFATGGGDPKGQPSPLILLLCLISGGASFNSNTGFKGGLNEGRKVVDRGLKTDWQGRSAAFIDLLLNSYQLKSYSYQLKFVIFDEKKPESSYEVSGGQLLDDDLAKDLALYGNKSWNDPKDIAKLVKAISLPQDVLSTSDRRLIELENQVQHLMEAHLAPKQPIQIFPNDVYIGKIMDADKSFEHQLSRVGSQEAEEGFVGKEAKKTEKRDDGIRENEYESGVA